MQPRPRRRWRAIFVGGVALVGGAIGFITGSDEAHHRATARVVGEIDQAVADEIVADRPGAALPVVAAEARLELDVEPSGIVVTVEDPRPAVAAARIPQQQPVPDDRLAMAATGAGVAAAACAATMLASQRLFGARRRRDGEDAPGFVDEERLFVEFAPRSAAAGRIREVVDRLAEGQPGPDPIGSVLVTGAGAGEHTGEIAINVAVAFAQREQDVLVVDEDEVGLALGGILALTPGSAGRLALPGRPPITCVSRVGVAWLADRDGASMRRWLAQQHEEHDIVVIHAASLEHSEQALAWAGVVDGVIVARGEPLADTTARLRFERLSGTSAQVADLALERG